MKKNKFNIILNWIIVLSIIYLLISSIITLLEPVFYGENTVGTKETNEEETINAMAATYKYFELYKEENYEGINDSLAYTIKEDKDIYEEYCKFVSLWQEDELIINEIKKKGSNKFIVKYSIKTQTDETLIIKINDTKKTYKIFYDSMLESY